MAGLPVFYGSPVSGYAERHLDLIGLGHLLALSHRPGLNELACVRFRYEFGRRAVYTVPQHSEKMHSKHQISGEAGGRILWSGRLSVDDLMERVSADVVVRSTTMTPNFGFDDYRDRYPDALILFMTDPAGRLHFPVGVEDMPVRSGWTVTAFVRDDTKN